MWKCQYCGSENEGMYCGNCGNKKQGETYQQNKKQKKKRDNTALILVTIIVAALMIIVFLGTYLLVIRSSNDTSEEAVFTDYQEVPEELVIEEEPEPEPELEPEIEAEPVEFLEDEPAEPSEKREEFYTRADNILEYGESSMSHALTQSDKNAQSGNVYREWDDLLNDVYKYLKKTMPAEEFKELQQNEMAWIKEKETAQNTVAQRWGDNTGATLAVNSVGIEYTQERCYYLISLIY